MPKTRRRKAKKAIQREPGVLPTPEQLASGEFERVGVAHTEGIQTNTLTYVRKKPRSALTYMEQRGSITSEHVAAAQQIASVVELLERSAEARCASLEARVDCSGSASDALFESLRMVRFEAAYSEWRVNLPLPRRMVIDMVMKDTGLKQIAFAHGVPWKRARKILIDALEAWPDYLRKYHALIDADALARKHAGLAA